MAEQTMILDLKDKPWFYYNENPTYYFWFEFFKALRKIAHEEKDRIREQAAFEASKRLYAEYLQSDDWKAVSDLIKEKYGWRCQICNHHKDEIQIDAHHRTYENLGMEQWEDLTVLCTECHAKHHNRAKFQ